MIRRPFDTPSNMVVCVVVHLADVRQRCGHKVCAGAGQMLRYTAAFVPKAFVLERIELFGPLL